MKKIESGRMKKYTFLFALLVFFAACQNKFDAPVSEEKLVKILADVHTAEAILETEKQEVRDSMTRIYYAQICEKHGVTKSDFDSTMAIYVQNPEHLDSVYSHVIRTINTQRDTIKVK